MLSLMAAVLVATGCPDTPDKPDEPEIHAIEVDFAKGADVSWLTQMEKEGCQFQDAAGTRTECMALLKSLGMNAIRLRVWVNPEGGWCGREDFLAKARRANDLGMALMVDFHYSDWWADPGKQNKPAAWSALPFEELKKALADHTYNTLVALEKEGIAPQWIQIGNETTNGMLWPDGSNSSSFDKYVQLNNAGYDAARRVFPKARILIHVDNGYDKARFKWFFDAVTRCGGKYDMVGMSLYPDKDNWQSMVDKTVANIEHVHSAYGKECIICEVGMSWDEPDACFSFISELITKSKATGKCRGVLYWEPEGYVAWSHYTKAAFDNDGKPTRALDAFKN